MADVCKKCGAEISPDNKFCMVCGEPVSAADAAPEKAAPEKAAPVMAADAPGKDSKYEPISTGGYIGIALLMAIPVLGFILTIIWACGGCRKVCKQNFAKAVLILLAIGIVIAVIAGLLLWPQISALRNSLMEVGGLAGLTDLSGQMGDLSELSEQVNQLSEAAGAANAG